VRGVCHYCGCRSIPLIIDFIAEHETATGLALDVVSAMDSGDLVRARTLTDDLARELRAHWQGEENGLFDVMRQSDEYSGYIATLIREHRELEALLASADLGDAGDQDQIRAAVAELTDHIRREEDGLFPASLSALDGDDWDRSIAAWQAAHPGSELTTRGS
jgi:iron-sulfur cluster repair protein YtfE (RIC family)